MPASHEWSAIVEKFLEFEEECGLFQLAGRDGPFWDYARYQILERILRVRAGVAETPRKTKPSLTGLAAPLRHTRIPNATYDIVLVIPSDRRLRLDGRLVNPYAYPVAKILRKKYRVLVVDPFTCAWDDPERYDCDFLSARIPLAWQRLRERGGSPDVAQTAACSALAAELERRLGARVDVHGVVSGATARQRHLQLVFGRVMRACRPRLVLYFDNGNVKGIIRAARESAVPAVECQHSIISSMSLLYRYPRNATNALVADVILTFGKFWHPLIRVNVPKVAVGFPYMELAVGSLPADPERADVDRTLLVISSGDASRARLIEVSRELVKRLPSHRIIYKLRGDEVDWMEAYPEDLRRRVTFVAGNSRPLYELFQTVAYQVGVNSTALYEGLRFGLRTFVVRAPGSDEMGPLVDAGLATVVDAPAGLVAAVTNSPGRRPVPWIREIFQDHCAEHLERAVGDLLSSESRLSGTSNSPGNVFVH